MRWKWIILICAAIFLLLIGTGYWTVSRYDFNQFKPDIVAAVKKTTGRTLMIRGDIRPKIGLFPALQVEDIAFENATWGKRPDLVTLKRFEIRMALLPLVFKRIVVKRVFLLEPDFLLEVDRKGRTNLDSAIPAAAEGETESASAMPRLRFDAVHVKDGVFRYRDARLISPVIVRVDRLTLSAADLHRTVPVDARLRYRNRAVSVKGTVGAVSALVDAARPWSVNLTATAGNTTCAVTGDIQDLIAFRGIRLHATLSGATPADMTPFLGIGAIPNLGPYAVDFHFSHSRAGQYRFDTLTGKLGKDRFSGALEIDIGKQRPRVTVVLRSRKFDARPVIAAMTGDEAEAGPDAETGKVFSQRPIPFTWLTAVDADITVNADRLLLQRLAFDNIHFSAGLKQGRLVVKPLNARIGEGTGSGSLSVRSNGRTAVVSMRFDAKQVDVGRMLATLGVEKAVDGTIDLQLDLTGSGRSTAELMANLSGSTLLTMGKGRLYNRHLNMLGGDLGSSLVGVLNPLKEKVDYSEIRCFVGRFHIREGIARSDWVILDTPQVAVAGKGRVDLRTETVNFTFDPSPKKSVGVKGIAGIGLSLGELTSPFKLGGTLAAPSLKFSPAGTAVTIGKAIGGFTLAGPFGLAAALVDFSSADENPCVTAMRAMENATAGAANGRPPGTDRPSGISESNAP